MLNKLMGRSEPDPPAAPPLRWYTAVTVYRDPDRRGSSARTVTSLRARSAREATLLFLAKTESGPPTLPGTDLSGWIVTRFDVSETGEDALEEHERRQREHR
ncbi:hypothetical protein [Streptomyces sp. NPDC048638]|uniref:hypothetical protein n=1 Tax=Streptomyces sp. NPDC048638 TaxID=3365580 RepID=UPI00371F588F